MPELATKHDWYMAVAYAVRDRMMHDWIVSFGRARHQTCKMVAYLSAEFLIGPQLGINLLDVGDIRKQAKAALAELGVSLDEIEATEPEPGLGNGGLGRLAACYMESLTTLEVPGHRIRHPLRVRTVSPGHPRRLAGGEDRQMAAAWTIHGRFSGRNEPTSSASAATPSNTTMSMASSGCAGFRRRW